MYIRLSGDRLLGIGPRSPRKRRGVHRRGWIVLGVRPTHGCRPTIAHGLIDGRGVTVAQGVIERDALALLELIGSSGDAEAVASELGFAAET